MDRSKTEDFSGDKEKLFALLLRQRGIASPGRMRIAARPAGDVCTQSYAQQRLWLLDQLEPNSAAYNIPSALRLLGPLDRPALQRSLNELVRRHEVLRTIFDEQDGQPVQCVREPFQLEVPLIDWSANATAEAELQQLADAESQRPFDLARGPLLRMAVIRLGECSHVLLFTIHHIVSDAWSMGVLVQELATLYRAFREDQPSPLAELKLQYADYAHWQRERLSGERLERELFYWQERLRGAPALLELPVDRPAGPIRSAHGAELGMRLSSATSEQLRELGRREGATLFMVMLAGFKALLARYSGQTDIVIGTPIANRHYEELEPLIGFFVNTLALRTDLAGEPSFRELLGRVRETALGAYAHQELPFEKLVEQLRPERRWSRTPIFQVMFVLQNAPMPPLELPGLSVSGLEQDNRTAKFDLTLQVQDDPDGLNITCEYSSDLFDAATVERLLEHYRSLLEGAVQAPERSLWQLPLSSEAQRDALLAASCGPHAHWPTAQLTLHQAFSQQAQRNPQRPALHEASGLSVSYAELDAASNRLANHLRALGVGLESRVGICLPRSSRSIESVLAVLKAGAAYVPLDPDYPLERLQYLIRDSALSVLISDTRVAALDALSATPGLPIVRLDADAQAIAEQSQGALDVGVDPDNLAYLIYTSGSTGLPKGVACTHRAVLNLIEHCDAQAPLPDAARCSAWTSMSFDVSVYEIFSALLQGGCLVWVPDPLRVDGLAMSRWLAEQRIQSAYVPPFMLAELSHCALHTALLLKRLLVGVEPIELQLLLQLQDRVPGLEILNGYGPTESTVCATMQTLRELAASSPAAGKPTPIGRALANLSAYVLDAHAQPVPIGVAGELYLGGTGLARGYWERPDLSAERFVPDACSGRSGQRLYRTGDRVRYLPDARLEFLGRIDEQLKIRGYRIEPAEIEAALLQLPGVQRAVVLARRDGPGDKRLVAYVEHEANASLTAAALRQDLKQRLPDFMLPAAFVLLPALPQTPHGKIDRNALPAPLPESTHALVEPRTPLEATLCRIWADVLQRPHVGIDDNFFELGGHSLLATQVISRVRKALQLELPLHSLFEEPNIAGLARGIQAKRWGDKALLPPPLLAAQRSDEPEQSFPQSFAQQRLWFLEQLEPGTSTYNIPNAVRLLGPLDLDALQHSLQALIERHESLRSRFLLTDLGLMQLVARTQPFSIAITNLESIPPDQHDSQLQDWLRDEAQRPFDLAHGPLLRVGVLRLQPLEHIVLLTIHHIIADGWSIGVLVRELGALYSAHRDRLPSALPTLPIQYADYAQWQLEWLQFGILEALLFYWQERLRGAPALLELPVDRPAGPIRSAHGAELGMRLSSATSEQLRELGRREGATLFMVMLAGFKALLARYSGQTDIVIGTPIANRHYEELEPLIGFFVNTLALRTDLAGEPSFRELLGRVRETALGAYAHQELPFEKLVEQLRPERRWSRTPIFQVMFVLQNAPMPPLELPGLSVSGLEQDNRTAKFDLTLQVQDDPDGLNITCEYSSDLFDAATVERLLEHYRSLLEGAVQAPERSLWQLPLSSEAQRDALLAASCGPHAHWPTAQLTLHQAFSQQAQRNPQRPALHEASGLSVSYAELDAASNRLANHLRALGVGLESRVGICLPRSSRSIESVLAVLKAGAAYVPLDPDYPLERLQYLIRDSALSVLISDTRVAALDALSATPGLPIVRLDADAQAIAEQSQGALDVGVDPDNLAYLIYTSGSTGLPKGVACTHRAVLNLIEHCDAQAPLPDAARCSAWTSMSFDVSVYEIFSALLQGGCLVWVPDPLRVDGLAMSRWLAEQRIQSAYVPPFMLAELSHCALHTALLLKRLLVGVEPIELQLLLQLQDRVPGLEILNGYGPTESTVCATMQTLRELAASSPAAGKPTPIGRALANLSAYVLDAHAQPVPIGVAGELYLGGTGLARGYWERPDLSAERFVPDACSGRSGQRLYRTGDRVRYLPDARLEFLGRIDEQLKIRGYRIEPAEIEAALLQLPGVQRAVVLARRDGPGDKRLVAYVEHEANASLTAAALRQDLKQRLPDFMLPAAFVLLPALPQTPHGKIDRNALPAPEKVRSNADVATVAPRDRLEKQLISIWEQMLDYTPIGITDNFFDIGGHSLLALQLQSRVRERFGVELPLTALFEEATVERLANYIRLRAPSAEAAQDGTKSGWRETKLTRDTLKAGAGFVTRLRDQVRKRLGRGAVELPGNDQLVHDSATLPPELVPIQSAGTRQPLFLVHPIGGSVLCYAELSRRLGVQQPCYGLQIPEQLQLADDDSVEAMAGRYVAALRVVRDRGPYAVAGWSFGGIVAYEMAQQLTRQGQDISLLALLDSFPFDPRDQEERPDELRLLQLFIADLSELYGASVELPINLSVPMPLPELLVRAQAVLEQARALPPDTSPAQFERMWLTYRGNYRAFERYKPEPSTVKLTLIMGSEPRGDTSRSPMRSWAPLARGGLNIEVLPGDHYALLREPVLNVTALKLEAFLSALDPGETFSQSRRA